MILNFQKSKHSFKEKIQKGTKIHTIRKDEKNRFKQGVMIDFKQWSGRPYHSNNLSFKERLPVMEVQTIEIYFIGRKINTIYVNDRYLMLNDIINIVKNDGFDSLEDFAEYFKTNFKGKIIHWTDYSY